LQFCCTSLQPLDRLANDAGVRRIERGCIACAAARVAPEPPHPTGCRGALHLGHASAGGADVAKRKEAAQQHRRRQQRRKSKATRRAKTDATRELTNLGKAAHDAALAWWHCRHVELDLYEDPAAELRHLREFRRTVLRDLQDVAVQKLGLMKLLNRRRPSDPDHLEPEEHKRWAKLYDEWLKADYARLQVARRIAQKQRLRLSDVDAEMMRRQGKEIPRCRDAWGEWYELLRVAPDPKQRVCGRWRSTS
jgi:hypothetical protein